jgi:phosphoribosylglycinamide formyltransferase-1
LVVLASGNGTNFQAVVDAIEAGALDAKITALVSNDENSFALARAVAAGVPAIPLSRVEGENRAAYDVRLTKTVEPFEPDFIVLAGWMRLLSMKFLTRFPNRVINLHPALPGEFPGTNSIERALEAAQRLGLRRTGVMVHFVPDEGVDNGPAIATAEVPIRPDDTIESLSARVHATEHCLLVEALHTVITSSAAP